MDWTYSLINSAVEHVWLIPLLPLMAFVIIILDRLEERLNFREIFLKKEYVANIVIGATAIGLIQSILIFIWTLTHEGQTYSVNYEWLKAGNLSFSFGWLVDNLSVLLLLVVTSVSMLIQIYTKGYMEKDPGYRKFFAYLAFFNFSMLGLVVSTNLFQIYIFWELVGLTSYLLIGFWHDRPSAAKAAKKAFVINRIGDCLFLIGIVSFLFLTYNYWIIFNHPLLSFEFLDDAVKILILSGTSNIVIATIAICLFFGAIAKSAQFPLHTWLPDAMEGPTPISALIHAATMVAAGVYLVARIYPIVSASPFAMTFIAWIGGITLFITATIAITQTDLKRVLAYSTCSQLGYMIMAMGLGAYTAGLFHLTTHAFFKAMLFLCAGAVIHGINDEQDMRFMGGLRKYMPITSWTFLIGAISISGVLLSGFWSKDMILGAAFDHIKDIPSLILFLMAFIGAAMTAFYMFRAYFMTFEGQYRGHAKPHESPKVMTDPLIILAVFSAFLGFALSGLSLGFIDLPSFSKYIYFVEPLVEHTNIYVVVLSLAVALSGIGAAVGLYWYKFTTNNPDELKQKLLPLYNLSFNKWYFDDIYSCMIEKTFLLASKICALFDKYVIDELVNIFALITKETGATLRYVQNGKVQFSALVMYAGLVIISVVLVLFSLI